MSVFRSLLAALLLTAVGAFALAQTRVQLPTGMATGTTPAPTAVYQNPPPGFVQPGMAQPGTLQPFDAYSNAASGAPSLVTSPQPLAPIQPQVMPGAIGAPIYDQSMQGAQPLAQPFAQPTPYGFGQPVYGQPNPYGPAAPQYGQAFPQQHPTSLFPNGFPTAQPGLGFDPGWGAAAPPYERLFQNTGVTYAWLYGGDGEGNEMEVNEIDVRTTAFIPRMLWSDAPLLITPGFTATFTEGPSPPVTADVPGTLYAAYLDFAWFPRITPTLGADLDVRVGVYSDFDKVTSDSIRVTGLGAADIVLTPQLRAKVGVIYLDRVDLKLLPYVGVIYRPHEYAQWDIIFPSPRYSRYMTTIGAHNTSIWWYVGAEYGGGSWTVVRESPPLAGEVDRMDYNDIRLYTGFEWRPVGPTGPRGFFEVGWVTQRELVYYLVPPDNTKLQDTFMLRTGIHF